MKYHISSLVIYGTAFHRCHGKNEAPVKEQDSGFLDLFGEDGSCVTESLALKSKYYVINR